MSNFVTNMISHVFYKADIWRLGRARQNIDALVSPIRHNFGFIFKFLHRYGSKLFFSISLYNNQSIKHLLCNFVPVKYLTQAELTDCD